jgi:hypothetical protein
MAAPNRNYELQKKVQLFVEFPFILFSNLKFIKLRKSKFFISTIHFAALMDSATGVATPFASPPPTSPATPLVHSALDTSIFL